MLPISFVCKLTLFLLTFYRLTSVTWPYLKGMLGIFFQVLFYFYVGMFSLYVHLCTLCVPTALRGQKRESGPWTQDYG